MAKTELIYGIHASRHLLESSADSIVEIWVQQECLEELLQLT